MVVQGISLRVKVRIAWWLPWLVFVWRFTRAEPSDETIAWVVKRAVTVELDAPAPKNP